MSIRTTVAALLLPVLAVAALAAMGQQSRPAAAATSQPAPPAALDPREKHLKNLHQVTFGGEATLCCAP